MLRPDERALLTKPQPLQPLFLILGIEAKLKFGSDSCWKDKKQSRGGRLLLLSFLLELVLHGPQDSYLATHSCFPCFTSREPDAL